MSFQADQKDLVLPLGSLILVTGASGFIGSHVVQEALNAGYRVRGTARSQDKAENTKRIFNNHPKYEAVVVEDMAAEGAFDSAIKDVAAVIHVASVVSLSPDPNEVITPTVAGVTTLLKSAAKQPSVKQFVLTSSSVTATLPKPGKKFPINKDTWNDEVHDAAWAPPPYEADRSFAVYAASKVDAERAAWKFVKEQSPSFAVNTVNPNANFGRILSSPGATGTMVIEAYQGKPNLFFPPQWMTNVTDDARIHIAAAVDGTVNNERIWAFDSPFSYNDILAACKKLRPDKKDLPESFGDLGQDLSEPDNKLGADLLRKWWGQDGYQGLLESVRQNLEGVE